MTIRRLALLLLVATNIDLSVAAQPRNIILIMADDVGYECFGCYGSRQYATPNLDRLSARGLRFEHCYSQPLCTPSRVKLMTGLSNSRNYSAFSVLRRDQVTIGQRFRQAGYRTFVTGKWQLLGSEQYSARFRRKGTWPTDAGFDEFCLWQVNQLGQRYWGPLLNVNGNHRSYDLDQYGPDQCTQALLDFVSTPSDQPFFAYYPMILVHDPFVPTPRSESRKSTNRQRNFEDMVAYMDRLIGRIVDHLHEAGLAEQTLLLFTSDNGSHRTIVSQLDGRTIRGGKGTPTDAGTRVPLIAYCPGTVPAGQTCDRLIDFTDFLPTLLSMAGQPISPELDGVSFWPQLCGQPGQARRWMLCYYNPRPERTAPIHFVRNQRWKLYGDGRFYDVASDARETHALPVEQLDGEARRAYADLSAAQRTAPTTGQVLLSFE